MRAVVLPIAVAALLLAGCGARTEPDDLSTAPSGPSDASGPSGDDSPVTGFDAGPDAVAGCGGGDGGRFEVVYALDNVGGLHRYDPYSGQSVALGTPQCADDSVQWTFTASPDHGYIEYTDGTTYQVSLDTLACTLTPLDPAAVGLDYDFGIAAVGSGAAERLFVYGVPLGGQGGPATGPILAVADTTSFALKKVGDVLPPPAGGGYSVNLTADGVGHLYAFAPGGPLATVQEIDSSSAAVVQSVDTGVTTEGTWATIAFGDSLYLWVGAEVVGYDLQTQSRTGEVDAGVSAVGASAVGGCPGP